MGWDEGLLAALMVDSLATLLIVAGDFQHGASRAGRIVLDFDDLERGVCHLGGSAAGYATYTVTKAIWFVVLLALGTSSPVVILTEFFTGTLGVFSVQAYLPVNPTVTPTPTPCPAVFSAGRIHHFAYL